MVDADVATENAEGEVHTENVEVPIENVEIESGNDSTEDENNDSENKWKMSLQEVVKKIVINPNGWGPVSIPESFRCLPYQAFDKSERISKIADWTGQLSREERRYGQGRYAAANANAAASTNQYAYYHEEEETAFQLLGDKCKKTVNDKLKLKHPLNMRKIEKRIVTISGECFRKLSDNVSVTIDEDKSKSNLVCLRL
ncbi:Eukaryotic translation initiation factor 3 subunit D [Trichinella pseudospiralis]|uniref:Eukaryotic translation initiation factor 3 subunit p66 n=1 Tax=Trichinella pseudospiralis TaxID=6337 RepID=A0A0V0YJT2_TRIPS|nr:Eukaryotic translation initiation factor 3 subunit D [Trichinella pseudospiralis]